MKQNSEIRFKVTTEEHDKIKQKAAESRLTIKEYILYLALETNLKVRVVVE